MGILLFVAALIALDIAALLWGVDSRESPNSPEWARRLAWAHRHGTGTKQSVLDGSELLVDEPAAATPELKRPRVVPSPSFDYTV